MHLIGISGWAGSGKTTAGTILRDNHDYHVEAFAQPLKAIVKILYNLPDDITEKDQTLEPWGLSLRQMYQVVGHDIFRAHNPRVWIDLLALRLGSHDRIVITDVRYPNEVKWIEDQGGQVWRIAGDRHINYDHGSEHALDEFSFKTTIENNGSLEDLAVAVKEILTPRPAPVVAEKSVPRPKVHLDPELHGRVKDFCREHNVCMKPWAEKVLAMAIEAGMGVPEDFTIRPKTQPPPVTVPVSKKPLPTIIEDTDDGPKPEEAPPFWATPAYKKTKGLDATNTIED